MTPDRVDFVDKYDARCGFFTLLKHVADAACADTHKHLNKIRAADGKERNVRPAGNGGAGNAFTGCPEARPSTHILECDHRASETFSDHAKTRRALALRLLLPRPRQRREM